MAELEHLDPGLSKEALNSAFFASGCDS